MKITIECNEKDHIYLLAANISKAIEQTIAVYKEDNVWNTKVLEGKILYYSTRLHGAEKDFYMELFDLKDVREGTIKDRES